MPKAKRKRRVWKAGYFSRSSTAAESEVVTETTETDTVGQDDEDATRDVEMHHWDVEGGVAPSVSSGRTAGLGQRVLRLGTRLLLHVLLYWAIFLASFVFANWVVIKFDQSPLFLPTGVHLLLLVLGGPYLYPAYLASELVCIYYVSRSADILPGAARALWPVVKGMILLAEAMALRYKIDLRLKRGIDLLWFVIITTGGNLLLGIFYAVAMILVGMQIDFVDVTFTRSIAHSVGAFTVLPLGLTLLPYAATVRLRGVPCPKRSAVWRFLAAPLSGAALLVACTAFAFVGDTSRAPRFYAYFLSLTFGSIVYGRLGSIAAAFAVNLLVIVMLHIQQRTVWNAIEAELYCIVMMFMGMVMGIAVDNDYDKGKALRAATVELERKLVLLSAAHTLAQALGKAKEQFMDDISHEVRTPLHGMLGYLSLLSASTLSSAQRRWVATMQGSATLLTAIVDDLLDVSKMASGRALSVRPAEFQLGSALEDAVALAAGMMGNVTVELLSVVEPALSVPVYADKQNLQRVVLNLVSNALKFTTQGSVILKARVIDLDADWVEVAVAVADTGCGIKDDDLQKLFQRFSQIGTVSKRVGVKGTGLGLAISKGLVETTMGGTIGVESKVDVGSTFWFTARLARTVAVFTAHKQTTATVNSRGEGEGVSDGQEGLRPVVLTPPLPPRRVGPVVARALFVHPCPTVCEAAGDALRRLGCAVHTSTTTDSACAAVLDRAATQWGWLDGLDEEVNGISAESLLELPLLLLFDCTYDAADLVMLARRCEAVSSSITRVLLSARGEVVEGLQAAGIVDKCLFKPLCLSAMASVLQESTGLTVQEASGIDASSVASGTAQSLKGARILVVDDNLVNQLLVQELLENLGVRAKDITVANDGEQAVAAYRKNIQKLDLIFMDCRMPVLDGFGATKRIRMIESDILARRGHVYGDSDDASDESEVTSRKKRPKTQIPIVALTAESMECAPKCLAADMNDVLLKPFTEDQLRDVVNKWVFRAASSRVQFVDEQSEPSIRDATSTKQRPRRDHSTAVATTPAMAGKMLAIQAESIARGNAHPGRSTSNLEPTDRHCSAAARRPGDGFTSPPFTTWASVLPEQDVHAPCLEVVRGRGGQVTQYRIHVAPELSSSSSGHDESARDLARSASPASVPESGPAVFPS